MPRAHRLLVLLIAAVAAGCPDDPQDSLSVAALSVTTAEDTPVSGTFEVQPASASVTWSVATAPLHGELVFTDGAHFTYTPTGDYAGTDSAVVSATDGTRSVSATVTLTVQPVNDAPVVTVPAPRATGQDAAVLFSSANRVRISDVDAASSELSVQLTADHGAFTLAATAGLTFTVGDGTAEGELHFRGTLAAIDAALDGLTLTPEAAYAGNVTSTLTVDDGGATGSGGPLTDEASFIVAFGDGPFPPFNTLPATRSTVAGVPLTFDGAVSVGDLDAANTDTVVIELTVTNGALTLASTTGIVFQSGANGAGAFTFSGALADVNVALDSLSYTSAIDFSGTAVLTLKSTSGGLSDTDTCDITVTPSPTPLPPTSANGDFFAPTLTPLPIQFTARGNNPGIVVESAVITGCTGDLTSTLVIEGTTVNCGSLPQLILVAGHATDTDDGNGLTHTFSGTWTPTSASTSGFGVTLHFNDSHAPALTSAESSLAFAHHVVNTPPTLQFIGYPSLDPPLGLPAGSGYEVNLCLRLDMQSGSAPIGFRAFEPDVAPDGSDLTFELQIIGGSGLLEMEFHNPSLMTQIGAGHWRSGASLNGINENLERLGLSVSGTAATQFDIALRVEDFGLSGACSREDTAPCTKVATALIHVDARSDAPFEAPYPYQACP